MPPARKNAARSASSKPKVVSAEAVAEDGSDAHSSDEQEQTVAKKAKKEAPEDTANDAAKPKCAHRIANMDGNSTWCLQPDRKRFITTSKFKNSIIVNIREYYEKDGKLLPGKKGIALSPEEFAVMRECAADIMADLQTMK